MRLEPPAPGSVVVIRSVAVLPSGRTFSESLRMRPRGQGGTEFFWDLPALSPSGVPLASATGLRLALEVDGKSIGAFEAQLVEAAAPPTATPTSTPTAVPAPTEVPVEASTSVSVPPRRSSKPSAAVENQLSRREEPVVPLPPGPAAGVSPREADRVASPKAADEPPVQPSRPAEVSPDPPIPTPVPAQPDGPPALERAGLKGELTLPVAAVAGGGTAVAYTLLVVRRRKKASAAAVAEANASGTPFGSGPSDGQPSPAADFPVAAEGGWPAPAPSPADSSPPSIPGLDFATPSDLTIDSLVARGGLCDIFLARKKSERRRCALKVLRPEFRDSTRLAEAVRREGAILRQLNERHAAQIFVRLLDEGTFQSGDLQHPYLVLEYIEGPNLRNFVRRRGSLAPRDTFEAVAAVASGLSVIHDEGLVHGDVSPENILRLDREEPRRAGEGRIRLIDFGDAQKFDMMSLVDEIVGKPAFLSPEQAGGLPAAPPSDVYSLGMVFYFLFVGRPAFTSENPLDVLRMHRENEILFPSGVPSAVQKVIRAMGAKVPSERPEASEAARLISKLISTV